MRTHVMLTTGAATGPNVTVSSTSALRVSFATTTLKTYVFPGCMVAVSMVSTPVVSLNRPGPPPKQPVKGSAVGSAALTDSIMPNKVTYVCKPKCQT